MSSALDPVVIERVLDEVRPHLHGDIALVAVEGADVHVRMAGRCSDCSMQATTLRMGVEAVLRSRIAGLGRVVAV